MKECREYCARTGQGMPAIVALALRQQVAAEGETIPSLANQDERMDVVITPDECLHFSTHDPVKRNT